MKKKIITKISEGLGNQLFMYAHAYSLCKKNNLEFLIDPYSGYFQKKHAYNFYLNKFNIKSKIAPNNFMFDSTYRNFFKNFFLLLDKFRSNKKFIFEEKKINKSTKYSPLDLLKTSNIIYLDGNFESEKYFNDYRVNLLKEFQIKNEDQFSNNQYLNIIKNENVVSICVRQNRYSERINNKFKIENLLKSSSFVEKTIDYIYKSITYFDNKIPNPKYLVWSNSFKELEKYFDTKKFIFVKNITDDNKIITDFYLLTQCKYFIVGPSTFHWWGAWLSTSKNKICVRPKYINPSNNVDFWPETWTSI